MNEKNLCEFIKKYPDVDYGAVWAAYVPCVGKDPSDVFEALRHVVGCFYCRRTVEIWNHDGSTQGILDQIDQRMKELVAERDIQVAEAEAGEENDLYRSGALAI